MENETPAKRRINVDATRAKEFEEACIIPFMKNATRVQKARSFDSFNEFRAWVVPAVSSLYARSLPGTYHRSYSMSAHDYTWVTVQLWRRLYPTSYFTREALATPNAPAFSEYVDSMFENTDVLPPYSTVASDYKRARDFQTTKADAYSALNALAEKWTMKVDETNHMVGVGIDLNHDDQTDATSYVVVLHPSNQINQEQTMNNTTLAFNTVHYVFGVDVSKMSDPELIDAIRKVEAQIAELKTVKSASKKIAAKIDELETMLASIIKHLDGEAA